ncbi:MAG: hypothetical protein IPM97_05105 [Bdellovibrionaceae bacterium]|nr:hypothetical protein [Pseudobdellovibrionaceae bacterium]
MKYVYILEDDPKFRDDIVEAVQKVDSQLAVRCFNSLESFAKWIKLLLAEGASSLSKGGQALPHLAEQVVSGSNDQLLLLICKNEFFGSKNMPLLQKTRELFITKGLCPPHEPTSLVITTFEDPDFDIKVVGDRIINNVIFKPFDKLILQQHLAFAISGRRPPSQYTIHNVKTTTTIEMLKDVEIEAISDVGFVSRSNRQIPVGALAKYYSPSFVSQKKQISMLATCVFSSPHPDYKDHFRCAFSYVAADPFQISNLRKEARKKEAKPFPFEWLGNVPKEPVHVAIICGDDEATIHFKTSLEKFFSNIKVHLFPHLQTFIYAIDLESAKKTKQSTWLLCPLFRRLSTLSLLKTLILKAITKTDGSAYPTFLKRRWHPQRRTSRAVQNFLCWLQNPLRRYEIQLSAKSQEMSSSPRWIRCT